MCPGNPKYPQWQLERVAPFDPVSGSLLNTPNESPEVVWMDVAEPFYLTLQCRGYSSALVNKKRNRSTRFNWFDIHNGSMYPMFVKDFYNLWGEGVLGNKNRTVAGWWKVVKKGKCYGIKFYKQRIKNPNVP